MSGVRTSFGQPVIDGHCAMRLPHPTEPATNPMAPCPHPPAYVVTLPNGVRFDLCANCTASARAHHVPLTKIEQVQR